MKVEIYRENRRWTWECHRCHRFRNRSTWRRAFDEGLAHARAHRTFGFQGGERRCPTAPPATTSTKPTCTGA